MTHDPGSARTTPSDAAIDAIRDAVVRAGEARTPLRIVGGGTKDFYGESLEGRPLDLRGVAGIVDYDPTELVIVARAGTPIDEVERTMAAAGQMLAFEPPRFAPGGTLGGAVAAGLSGPRRPYAGAVRDLVLGAKIVDGRGRHLAFGGRVMKNVAGFDLSRLMCGAMGTLGVVTEVSLKCLPRPKAEETRVWELSSDEAIRRVNEWGGQPLPISATCWHHGTLAVRFSGAASAVASAVGRLGGAPVPHADAFWESVRDHVHTFFHAAMRGAHPLWRLSVKSTAPHADLGGEQLIEWGGALRWLAATPRTDVAKLRAWAVAQGGHATMFRADELLAGSFHPLPPVIGALHRRLKAAFDPHAILNPGRTGWYA